MIKILIIEDHKILIDGIKELLAKDESCRIVYEAYTGASGIEMISNHEDIDVVILDINLPDILGVEVCEQIVKLNPNIPILTLTMHESPPYLKKMINAGAKGYILKDTSKEEIIDAINTVHNGDMFFSEKVKTIMVNDNEINKEKTSPNKRIQLTGREKEVLKLILQEFTNEEMAIEMKISYHTVISHRKNLLKKLGAKNTAGMVKKVIELDLLQ